MSQLQNLIGKTVYCTSTRRLGFKCVNLRGVVSDTDHTERYNWVRVHLDNGIVETFRKYEITEEREKIVRKVTKTGLKLKFRKKG